jgi:hypothetical protein
MPSSSYMKSKFGQPRMSDEMTGNLSVQRRVRRPAARSSTAVDASRPACPPARRTRVLALVVGTAFAVFAYADSASAFDNSVSSVPSREGTVATSTVARPAYPLKASANNRYLVDQDNVPFLMIGDSPQALIGKLSEKEAATFIANRQAYGINALWINLLCNDTTGCKSDGTTFDGIAPFTEPGDLSTPNPAYFQRADDLIRLAAMYGIIVILDPIETIGWLDTLKANGLEKAFAYGQYLGTRYTDVPNIIWMHGNDFQSWRNSTNDALVRAVALGIRSEDSKHLHTVELNYMTSGSLDDASWAPIIGLNAAYTYYPTYAQVLREYNRPNFKPVFMVEANYEFEHNPNTDGGSTQNLRRQAYWTMLSGATGQLYGSFYTWQFPREWQTRLDTPGISQLSYLGQLFAPRKWHDLVPDQDHAVMTRGWGRYSTTGSITTNTYATSARTSDGSLVITYMPTIRTITVDMSKLAGITTARWFDPTKGSYVAADGSPFVNVGGRRFTPPGNNSAGDGDWVLVLEAAARSE